MITRAGFGLEKIDNGLMAWSTLTALVDGLVDDHTSHTFASLAGWSYVPSPAEVQFYNELDVKIAMNRGKNQPVPAPVKRPWEKRKLEVSNRFDPGSTARRAKLNAMLGLGGVVDADDKPDGQPQSDGDDAHQ